MARALLGGGCFWCTEGAYKNMRGIDSALPAYAGGPYKNPNYNSVCSGTTGHAEIVEVIYDPNLITFETILEVFFTVHDPEHGHRVEHPSDRDSLAEAFDGLLCLILEDFNTNLPRSEVSRGYSIG